VVNLIAPSILLLWVFRAHLHLQRLDYERGDLTHDGMIYQFSAAPHVWEAILEEKARKTKGRIWGCIVTAGAVLFGPSLFAWARGLF